jgi:RsiW-degrading membrane proteinase PrsW (M82 family)
VSVRPSTPRSAASDPAAQRRARAWVVAFLAGLVLWAASTATLVATGDDIVLPTVVISGSFLVPVTCIFWLLEHRRVTALTPERLVLAFFVAGVLGMIASAALERWLLPSRTLPNLWVGLIEEAAKGVGLVLVARGLPRHLPRDGLILGATVGLGFGAFESSGYALTYGFDRGEFSASSLVSEEILRAALAPFGHGVWTGLLGAAVFAAARDGRLRLTIGVLGAYVGVALMHALWDASSTLGVVVAVAADGTAAQREAVRQLDFPSPSSVVPAWLYGTVQWTVMLAVAAVGAAMYRRRWRAS